MKRFIVPALALAALLLAQSTALAEIGTQAGNHWVYDNLLFRSYNNSGVNATLTVPVALDSVAASGIAKFDTTTALSTSGWGPAPGIGSAVDSSLVAHLYIFDSGLSTVTLGRTSATAESIYVKAQVSANGADWHDLAVLCGQAPVLNAFTVQTTVNASVLTFVSSTNTGVSGKLWSVRYVTAQGGASLKSGQDIYHMNEFPLVRFIIMGSRSLNHSYSAILGHWSTSQAR